MSTVKKIMSRLLIRIVDQRLLGLLF
jgi:hypothetical protein